MRSTPSTGRTFSRWSWRAWLTIGVFAMLLAVVGWRLWRVHQQRSARAALDATGWTVVYGDPAPAQATFLQQLFSRVDATGSWTGWLVSLEPEPVSITVVDLDDVHVERDLRLLTRLSQLETFSLHRSEISERDVGLIASLSGLRDLTLAGDQLDDHRLSMLAPLSRLERLTLISQRVSDEGIAVVADFPALKHLDIQGTRVTGAGLRHLSPQSRLLSLQLGPAADDDGLAAVGRLAHLQELTIASRRITDEGVEALSSLQQLQQLVVADHPALTDAGLVAIARLPALRSLTVHSHLVTFDGVSRLQQLTELADLELRGVKLDDHGLERFTPPPSLSTLRLYHTSVSDGALDTFEASHPDIELWR